METPPPPRRRAAVAVCTAVAAVTALSAWRLDAVPPPPPPAPPAAAPVRQTALFELPDTRWEPTWSDEFAGTGPPAKTRWAALTGGTGWGHEARQYFDPRNARLDGLGRLVITAERTPHTSAKCWYGRCKYKSARIQTKGLFSQAYGRFSARIRMPTGKAVWPAFWMQREKAGPVGSPTYGEIDIVETRGQEPDLARGYLHAKGGKGGGVIALPRPLDEAFHVYGVDWTPASITWWVDGKPFAQFPRYRGWPFTRPFFLVLSLQVGGRWVGRPDASTPARAEMTVDWVRAYRAA